MSPLLQSLRPRHWVKNLFVFATILFAGRLTETDLLLRSSLAFVVFCAISSAVYLLNDLFDRDQDRLHPIKKLRPIAAGRVGVVPAAITALILSLFGLAMSWWLTPRLTTLVAVYLLMQIAYTLVLKRIVIVDVMIIAFGFLLRTWAGSVAIDIHMSRWLVLCTLLIALFLGFIKRRQELTTWDRESQRPILRRYKLPFLDQCISLLAGTTLLAYSLYALSPEVSRKVGNPWMGLTIPFVVYGILRYLHLMHSDGEGENPTALLLSDLGLQLAVLAWGLAAGTVLYIL